MGSSTELLCTHTACNCVTYTNSPNALRRLRFAFAPHPQLAPGCWNYSAIHVTGLKRWSFKSKGFFLFFFLGVLLSLQTCIRAH